MMKIQQLLTGTILASLVASPLQVMANTQESNITEIRALYNEINQKCTVKEVISKEVTLYNDNDATSKDYKITYSPIDSNTVYDCYFEDGEIFFVFSNSRINKINYENRYYFNEGNMIRWIDDTKTTYDQDYGNYNYISEQDDILTQAYSANAKSHMNIEIIDPSHMEEIIAKSFTCFNIRDNYGKHHTVYAYADNATSEIQEILYYVDIIPPGINEGDILITGYFNLAYLDTTSNKIINYNLMNDLVPSCVDTTWDGGAIQVNTSPDLWKSRRNAYIDNTDFINIVVPESTMTVTNYMYTIRDGQICKALDKSYNGYMGAIGDITNQTDAYTFNVESYNNYEHATRYDSIIYNPQLGQFFEGPSTKW
ncbi:hypothetical protein AN639_06610 [Candidatus Epulonipiscium fishelsonii]|uniref:Uncharacterized protein n=1 Tax=Candidatus Epulonipiscium fishelsonii TaxID=77094 RepID=A0ACC8XGQ1_9FIRM|nr:hypothetical protein AN639_06610 [Epulopiscium sp. SCG-B05WGA-EpuloA1]ONI42829.1 hypothetical protein AN396_13070 [Epulopiscium sp. SCG-B11WGA-EpuloA1]ONI46716.1 hypothetical protein AN644_02770 [Epulopiscium sp. SCG-C06WGA-EpuloA1]